MTTRRSFMQTMAAAAAVLAGDSARSLAVASSTQLVSQRPHADARTYASPAIERAIGRVKETIKHPKLAWMFENCFPNTLDTTVDFEVIDGKPDAFIITGDIDAMWLRDSTAQVWPYFEFASQDSQLQALFQGLINRQVKCVLLDPYANAFYKDLSRVSYWKDDKPTPQPGVHERKWEIDSLCYVIRLSYEYYRRTGDVSVFDSDWDAAMRLIVQTFRTEQRKDSTTPYSFARTRDNSNIVAPFYGKGRPSKPVGLIASAFRPSDDGCMYPYLIPSNFFAVQSLTQLSKLYIEAFGDHGFAQECDAFASEVSDAIETYAVSKHLGYGKIYAYEVDGFGNKVFVDDPNVPSLIALRYLLDASHYDDRIYENTRRYLLSTDNPYYFIGEAGEGQGGPHAGMNTIWPMGIILRAMTSRHNEEIIWCVNQLMNTDAGTGFMHETFHKDDASQFSRSWFAWANTLFGELIVKLSRTKPDLLVQI